MKRDQKRLFEEWGASVVLSVGVITSSMYFQWAALSLLLTACFIVLYRVFFAMEFVALSHESPQFRTDIREPGFLSCLFEGDILLISIMQLVFERHLVGRSKRTVILGIHKCGTKGGHMSFQAYPVYFFVQKDFSLLLGITDGIYVSLNVDNVLVTYTRNYSNFLYQGGVICCEHI